MAQTIKLRRSSTEGKVPTTAQLALGELAINTYDGRIFFEKNDGSATIQHIVTTNSIATGSLTITGSLQADNITIDGATVSSDLDLTIDSAGDITLDADGADVLLKDGGTSFGRFNRTSSDFVIKSETNDKDIVFKGVDNSATITALTLDMSEAGAASFNSTISATGATLSGLSAQNSEATSLMINGSGVVGTRELGSNAFTSTTIGTTTNALTDGTGIADFSFDGSGTATISTDDSAIVHDNLSGFVANEHIDHTSVSITAGTGLNGGGTIASTRTLNVDSDYKNTSLNSFTASNANTSLNAATSSYLTSVDISDDTNLSGGTGITLTGDTLSTTDSEIVHDNLSGFVANEHIDHSSVSITAGTGLSGGGSIASTRTLNVDDEYLNTSLNSFTASNANTSLNAATGSYITAVRSVTAGGNTLASSETLAFTAGTNVTITESGGAVTIASTDTNTQLSTSDVRGKFSAGEGIDISSGEISGEDASTSNKGIVELATTAETTTGTDTARAVTPDGLKDGYQGSTNVTTLGTISTGTWNGTAIDKTYLDDEVLNTSLNSATSSYQPKPSEGQFADGDKTKLDSIEASADVTDATNVKSALNGNLGTLTLGDSNDTVSIPGNLSVAGTRTFVESTTVQLDDNILELNGGGTADGGIYVRDAEASTTVTGSLIWNTGDDKWTAGPKGSEDDIVLATATQTLTNKTLTSPDVNSPDIDGGNIDGATIATSNITVGSGKTLNVSGGTLTTSTAQKVAIIGGGDTDDLSEGSSNLYFTNARARGAISAGEGIDISSGEISGEDASTSNKGIVELATTAETTTGTDTARAVTPDGLKDGYQGSTNVTTLGTIATGTWNGTAIDKAYLDDEVYNTSLNAATGSYLTTVDISSDTNLAGGTGITLTGDTLSTTDSEIVHDNLSGFVSNEHIDHTGVSIIAGTGLNGGGTIASSRTLNVDDDYKNTSLNAATSSYLTTVDISSNTNLAGGTGITLTGDTLSTTDGEIVHDNLSGFVSNEHINHSSVSITAGTGLNGGGDLTSTRTLNVDDEYKNTSLNAATGSYITAVRTITAGGNTLASSETLAFTAGSNVTITESGGAVTIASTDTNTQLSTSDVRGKFSAGEGIDISSGEISGEDASTSNKGIVELATTAETTTGTDTARAVTPDGLKDGYQGSTNVTTLGTIATGTWNGSVIDKAYLDDEVLNTSLNSATGSYLTAPRTITAGGNTLASGETLAFSAGSNVSISESGGTVTISSTDTNTNTFRTVTAGGNTLGGSETLAFTAGSNVTITESGGAVTIASTDTNTQLSTSDVRGKFSAGEGIDISSGEISGEDASTSNKGIVELATTAETTTGTDTARAVTPDGLKDGYQGSTNVTTLGTITTGTWNGTIIHDDYLSANTVHLDTTQTLTGAKTFSAAVNISNSTSSTSKTTGALIVTGGIGLSGALNVGGDVTAFASSDERYKDLITPIQNPNEKIKLLSGNTFVWNDKHEIYKGKKDIGVIAQEVEKVLPEIVETREDGYKAVKYEKIVALLIESNKELIKRVEELESKIK